MSVRFAFIVTLFTAINVRGGRLLLALYALELQASPLTVGVLAATFSLLPVVLSVWVGRLSDRFGTRWPLSFGIFGGCAGIVVPFFSPTLTALFIAAIMNGLAFSFFSVTLHHVIGQLSAPKDRTRNFSTFSQMISGGMLISPLIVGFTIDLQGHAASCLYLGAIGLVPVVMLLARGDRLPGATAGEEAPKVGLLKVLRDPRVLRVMIINSLHQTGSELFSFYMPVYTHGIGMAATAIGIIMSLFAVAGFVVRMALSWLLARSSAKTVLSAAMLISAAVCVFIPFSTHVAVLGLLALLFGLAINVGQPIILSLSYSNAPDGRPGETLGLRQTVTHASRVAAPVGFGWLAGFGPIPVFIAGAALLVAGAAVARRGDIGELDK